MVRAVVDDLLLLECNLTTSKLKHLCLSLKVSEPPETEQHGFHIISISLHIFSFQQKYLKQTCVEYNNDIEDTIKRFKITSSANTVNV